MAPRNSFVLQKVQPALLGLMDGAVSTLAPLFAAAGLSGKPSDAFFVGLAASLGAGIATAIGGMLHTFPFLLPNLQLALNVAYGVVVFELLAIAVIRFKFMKTPLLATIGQVIVGGGIVFGIGLWLGNIGAGG